MGRKLTSKAIHTAHQSAMATYKYKELNVQRREIRLCTLLPGLFDEPLACTLSVVSLDEESVYESLSYAWGSPIFDKELVVKDAADSIVQDSRACKCDDDTGPVSKSAPDLVLPVTTNLHTAFQYLRKSGQTHVVRILERCHLVSWYSSLLPWNPF